MGSITNKEQQIDALRNAIEDALHKRMESYNDFDLLSD